MARFVRPLALLLVLVLLLSSSGAATLCVEADGTTRVELLGAVCCDVAPAPPGAEPGLTSPDCGGCDDTPLADGSWSRPGADACADALLTLALPPAEAPPALAPAGLVVAAPVDDAPAPSPRAARPASSLRC